MAREILLSTEDDFLIEIKEIRFTILYHSDRQTKSNLSGRKFDKRMMIYDMLKDIEEFVDTSYCGVSYDKVKTITLMIEEESGKTLQITIED